MDEGMEWVKVAVQGHSFKFRNYAQIPLQPLNVFSPTSELKCSPPYHSLMNNVNEDQANV